MNLSQLYFLNEIGGKKSQEDYIWPPVGTAPLDQTVFIISDGVGGSENGEIASRIISESVGESLRKTEKTEVSEEIINDLLMTAQEELVQFAFMNGLNTDMATTFTLLILSEKKAFLAWCGDSRIYHFRNGKVLYKTSDHSLVNSLVKNGEITEDEALIHPRRNVILRAIKADGSPIDAEYHCIDDVHDGDYFMLCSDGLLENITDNDLKSILEQNDKQSIDLLEVVQQFCFGKTKDNYSMYLMKVKLNSNFGLYKKKLWVLASWLIILLTASAFIFIKFFVKKQEIKGTQFLNQPVDSNKISLPKLQEKEELIPLTFSDTNKKRTEPTSIIIKSDESNHITFNVQKKIKKVPILIIIDDSSDLKNKATTNESSINSQIDSGRKAKAVMPPKDSLHQFQFQ